MGGGIESLKGSKTVLLTTFRRDGTRGEPTGPPVQARATLLDGGQAQIAARALARRHRVLQAALVPLIHRLMRYRTLHYELRCPDP